MFVSSAITRGPFRFLLEMFLKCLSDADCEIHVCEFVEKYSEKFKFEGTLKLDFIVNY